ncbi:MAG: Flp pilus assembly protein CpaB [Proteobacteria bacterium]|nr:Flp pilus assembly protein CpaB [Pseudomonadota bacterium]
MRLIPVFIFIFALIIAGAVFFIAPRFLAQPQQAAVSAPEVKKPALRVAVASRDLSAGTILKEADLGWQPWPEDGVRQSHIIDGQVNEPFGGIVGAAVKRGINVGTPMLATYVVRRGDAGFIAAALTPGMRAAAVKIDAVTGAGGLIIPGDRVDVVLSERRETVDPANQRTVIRHGGGTIIEDLRVLAVDQNIKDIDDKPKVGATATLEVTSEQGSKLAIASEMGKLSLVLRSLAHSDSEEPHGGFVEDVNISRYLATTKAGGGEAQERQAPTVRVYRGTAEQGAAGGSR